MNLHQQSRRLPPLFLAFLAALIGSHALVAQETTGSTPGARLYHASGLLESIQRIEYLSADGRRTERAKLERKLEQLRALQFRPARTIRSPPKRADQQFVEMVCQHMLQALQADNVGAFRRARARIESAPLEGEGVTRLRAFSRYPSATAPLWERHGHYTSTEPGSSVGRFAPPTAEEVTQALRGEWRRVDPRSYFAGHGGRDWRAFSVDLCVERGFVKSQRAWENASKTCALAKLDAVFREAGVWRTADAEMPLRRVVEPARFASLLALCRKISPKALAAKEPLTNPGDASRNMRASLLRQQIALLELDRRQLRTAKARYESQLEEARQGLAREKQLVRDARAWSRETFLGLTLPSRFALADGREVRVVAGERVRAELEGQISKCWAELQSRMPAGLVDLRSLDHHLPKQMRRQVDSLEDRRRRGAGRRGRGSRSGRRREEVVVPGGSVREFEAALARAFAGKELPCDAEFLRTTLGQLLVAHRAEGEGRVLASRHSSLELRIDQELSVTIGLCDMSPGDVMPTGMGAQSLQILARHRVVRVASQDVRFGGVTLERSTTLGAREPFPHWRTLPGAYGRNTDYQRRSGPWARSKPWSDVPACVGFETGGCQLGLIVYRVGPGCGDENLISLLLAVGQELRDGSEELR